LIVCAADVSLVVADVDSLLKSLSASSAVADIPSVSRHTISPCIL